MWRYSSNIDEVLRDLVIVFSRGKGSQDTRQGTISFDEDPKGPEMRRIYTTSSERLCYDNIGVVTTRGAEHRGEKETRLKEN